MLRLLMLAFILACGTLPVSAQTTDAGYADALSPSLAGVAKAMHGTIRLNYEQVADKVTLVKGLNDSLS